MPFLSSFPETRDGQGLGRNWLDLTVLKIASREEIAPLLIFVRKNLAIRGIV